MFAVVVRIWIAPEDMAGFMLLMHENARTSRLGEAGCHRFDVLCDPDRPGEVLLYELYTDAEAFETHLESPHYSAFSDATSGLILSKDVHTYREVAS